MTADRVPPGRAAVEALGDPRADPDPAWVASLAGVSLRRVRSFFSEMDRRLRWERQIRVAHVAGGRDSYAQIRAPLELYALGRALRPAHVVEAGVSSGVSSAHFLLALRANRSGRLHSIDLPVVQLRRTLSEGESPVSVPPGASSGWAVPEGLRRPWDLRLGPTQQRLPELVEELPRIDLFLHDDQHTPAHLAWELRTIRDRLPSGAVVLADNTRWTGRSFPAFARELGAEVVERHGSDLVGLRVP